MDIITKDIAGGSILLVLSILVGMNGFFLRRLVGKMDLLDQLDKRLALIEASVSRFSTHVERVPTIETDMKILKALIRDKEGRQVFYPFSNGNSV